MKILRSVIGGKFTLLCLDTFTLRKIQAFLNILDINNAITELTFCVRQSINSSSYLAAKQPKYNKLPNQILREIIPKIDSVANGNEPEIVKSKGCLTLKS